MKEDRHNIIVGIFVLCGLILFGWLVFRFGDLPAFVSRYDAREVTIYLPSVPGIQENSAVMFRGYPVGKVILVKPPALVAALDDAEKFSYQVELLVTISEDYMVPDNVVPKVYRKGLGASFVDLVSEGEVSGRLLEHGAKLQGVVSWGGSFIPESTQKKIDQLIDSLMQVSISLEGQLTHLPPEIVDKSDPNKVRANITTAIIRMDESLKNLNIFLGDRENQRNVKKVLSEFALLCSEMRELITQQGGIGDKAQVLIEQSRQTIEKIDHVAGRIQEAADGLAMSMKSLNEIFKGVSAGEGTVGRLFNDPRLYESLADTSENLAVALKEMRQLMAQWQEKGVQMKLK